MPQEALEIQDRSDLAYTGGFSDASAGMRTSHPFSKGQTVRHPQFGLGRIAEINEMGQHTRAIVEFNKAGRKTLILEYARLEAV